VAHVCNPSYWGCRDQEDQGWKPAQGNSKEDPISEIASARWTSGVAQVIQHLLCKCEALSSRKKRRKGGREGRKGEKEREKKKRERRKEGRKEGREERGKERKKDLAPW
jgi:hypothetical protein